MYYGYTTNYQDSGERHSKKARTSGYQDSGYTNNSTNYAGFSAGGNTSFSSNVADSWISGMSGNKSFSSGSGGNTFSTESGVTNWYESEGGSQSGSARGQTQNFGRSTYSKRMTQGGGLSQKNQDFSSRSTLGIASGSGSQSGSGRTQNYGGSGSGSQFGSGRTQNYGGSGSGSQFGSGRTQNYGGSSYRNRMEQDNAFSLQKQEFSGHSTAGAGAGFRYGTGSGQTQNYGESSYTNLMNKMQSNRPADTQTNFTFSDSFEDEGNSKIGRGFGNQRGKFKKEIPASFETPRTFDTSQKQVQQGNIYQNRKSGWESQQSYGDFDDTRQGQRSVFAQGKDESDFETDLTLRMAAEIQQRKRGKVDVNKILKVMEIVDQMSEIEDVKQGFVEEERRGMTAKPVFGLGQDFHGTRGSFGRQNRSNSRGGGMNMMKQGGGNGFRGQGSQMGMVSQGTGFGMMAQGVGMIDQKMNEDGDIAMMGPGSGRSMVGSMYGVGITGRESWNRPNLNFAGNQGGRPYRQRVPFPNQGNAYPQKHRMFQESGNPRSLMDMHIPMPEKIRKFSGAKPKTGSQSKLLPDKLENMSLSEKFGRFIKFFRSEDLERNPINVIDNAVDKSRLGLQKDFKFEPYLNADNREMVSARLFISGIFLARTCGTKRKEVKRECYEKAMQLLKTKSTRFIMKQKDSKIMEKESIASEEKKVEVEDEDEETREFRKKLEKLHEHMRSFRTEEDDDFVGVLSDAFTKFELDYTYSDDEETKSARGTPWFIGNLKVGDLHVGVGSGPSMKYAKRRAFSRAVYFLKTKELTTVMKGVVAAERDLIPGFELLCEMSVPNSDTEERLAKMIDRVLEMPEGKPVKLGIEDAVRLSDLKIALLFKSGRRVGNRTTTQCDLFIDRIFICSGEAYKRAEAESKAYQEALTVICSSSADLIFNDFKRMSREDAQCVLEITEIWSKGRRNTLFFGNASKVARLKAGFPNLIPEEGSEDVIDKDEIIIMENNKFSGDRFHKAFDVLQTSAFMNLMILQGRTSQYAGTSCCNLFLQHVRVSQGTAANRRGASTLAAAKALFKLYQSRPTIGIADHDEAESKFSYETMMAKADALKEESGDTGDDDYIYIANEVGKKEKPRDKNEDEMEVEEVGEKEKPRDKNEGEMEVEEVTEEDHKDGPTSTLPVNKWLKQVIEEMIQEYASEESLQEIVFFGDFPLGDRTQVRLTAQKYNIDTSMYNRNGVNNIVVYQKYFPAKILEILQNKGGRSGVYSIIAKDELPKPSDIESFHKSSKNKNSSKSKATPPQHSQGGGGVKRQYQQMSQ